MIWPSHILAPVIHRFKSIMNCSFPRKELLTAIEFPASDVFLYIHKTPAQAEFEKGTGRTDLHRISGAWTFWYKPCNLNIKSRTR